MKIAIFSAERCRSLLIFMLWLFAFVLTGCAPKIPNVVSAEEYQIFSAWIKHDYSKKPTGAFYLATETFIRRFDFCQKNLKSKGVDSLAHQLEDLGDAKFLVYASRSIHSPWPFQEANEYPPKFLRDGAFRVLQFTRVAFNQQHTAGLFAISEERGYRHPEDGSTEIGLGGGSGIIARRKQDGTWAFEETGCITLY